MRCYCCEVKIKIGRKVKLRPRVDMPDPPESMKRRGPEPKMSAEQFNREQDEARRFAESPAYKSYVENMTYRWTFICNKCYRILDNPYGMAEIGAKTWNIAGQSRGDKAAVVDELKHEKFQRAEAAKLGIEYTKEGA